MHDSFGHVAIFCTWAYDLILPFRELFQERSRFAAWFLSYLGWVYSKQPRKIRFAYFDLFGWTP